VIRLLTGVALLAATVLPAEHAGVAPPLLLQVAVQRGAPGAEDVATGFALGDGRAVTVAHVLDGHAVGSEVRVRSPGGPARAATVVAIDQRSDLALLRVPGLRAPEARTAAGRGRAIVLTLDAARAGRVRRPIVARILTPDGSRVVRRPSLELRVRIGAGDSGAPVLTPDGRVAGVVFARSDRRPDTAYAVEATLLPSSR
jgi:S1-C subfamily serine protease